jgi:Protein of unknown function (DUF1007)
MVGANRVDLEYLHDPRACPFPAPQTQATFAYWAFTVILRLRFAQNACFISSGEAIRTLDLLGNNVPLTPLTSQSYLSSPHSARNESSLWAADSGIFRIAALGLAFGLATTAPAGAHPHVCITVKSQMASTPDGKVSAVIHDWVFDEMYSSFATQGRAPPGQLVKKEQLLRWRRRTPAAWPKSAISPH